MQLCAAKLNKSVNYTSSLVFLKDPVEVGPCLPKYWQQKAIGSYIPDRQISLASFARRYFNLLLIR